MFIGVFWLLVGLTNAVTFPSAEPGPIGLVYSDIAGARLSDSPFFVYWHKPTGASSTSTERLYVDPVLRYQTIDGFGGSFLRSGSLILLSVPEKTRKDVLRLLFHPTLGGNFRVGKIPIGATDMSPPVWYSYQEEPTGPFSIAYDVAAGGTVWYVNEAQHFMRENGVDDVPLELQATLDFPPHWMLNTTGHPCCKKATVSRNHLQDLAKYYLDFSLAVKQHGVPLKYLSLFNEPPGKPSAENYGSYSNELIAELLTKHVGPLFRRTTGAPLLTWSTMCARQDALAAALDIMPRPGVLEYTDILMYHGYDGHWVCDGNRTICPTLGAAMKDIATLHSLYPDKKMWMTEICYAVEFDNYPKPPKCPKIPRLDFMDGFQWGAQLFGDLESGASAWIYWNMVLDQEGGPWLVSPEHDDPPNNYQHPLIVVNTNTYEVLPTAAYYILAHFGRYVERGCVRIESKLEAKNKNDDLRAIAFECSDTGKIIVQVMNESPSTRSFNVEYRGWEADVTVHAYSMTTLIWKTGD